MHLESHLDDQEKKEVSYSAIESAAKNGHVETVNHFLERDCALVLLESRDREYGEKYVYPFIAKKLAALHARKSEFETANPQDVFTLSDEESKLCFYMLRNLIRRTSRKSCANREALYEEMRFLLSVPSVRLLVHECVNSKEEGSQKNELLMLALSTGNKAAINMLLALEESRTLDLSGNLIGTSRARALSEALLRNTKVVSLTYMRRGIESEVHEAIDKELAINQAIPQAIFQLEIAKTLFKVRMIEDNLLSNFPRELMFLLFNEANLPVPPGHRESIEPLETNTAGYSELELQAWALEKMGYLLENKAATSLSSFGDSIEVEDSNVETVTGRLGLG